MFPIKRSADNDKASFAVLHKKSKTIKLPPKVTDLLPEQKVLPATIPETTFVTEKIVTAPKQRPCLPFTFMDDIDRENAFGQIEDWIKAYTKIQKPLLIAGHTGSGKTTLIEHYFIKHLHALPETYDENGSTREDKHDDCTDYLRPHGLIRQRLPAIFDNIESYDLVVRDILRSALLKFKSQRPFIMTTDDIFIEPAKSFAKHCVVVRLENPKPSFVTKILNNRKQLCPQVTQSIIEVSNGNLANALNCLGVISDSTDASSMFQDRPMDVPKATRCALLGEDVPLLGGSSDTSFLGIMLQVNSPQVPQSIEQLANTLERFSFLNVVDSVEPDKKLLTEQLWLLIQKTYIRSAKLQKSSRFNLDWPRSLNASKNPWPYGGYFYEL